MKWIPTILLLALSIGTGLLETAARAQDPNRGAQLYQQACAACHGAELQGGNAQSLVDRIWQFGSGRGHMLRNIKYGIPDFSMPGFELALSDAEMNQIIDHILQAEKTADAPRKAVPTNLFTSDYELKVEVVAEGLDVPWGIDFVDDRTALVTERSGRLRLIVDGKLQSSPIAGTPKVIHEGQGGLLDVAVDPEYSRNGWIYLVYSHALEGVKGKDRPPAMTRLVRGQLKNQQWVDEQIVYEAPQDLHLETRHHYGSRIVFDPDGYLYFSIGDRGVGPHAQDLRRPNGKVHRIHRDGRIPADNPFVGVPDALPSIFTWGNRNAQGLAVHPVSGTIWATEHGPMGGDELNLLSPGKNYGWPLVSYGRNYDGAQISALREKPGVQAPVLYWTPSIAVCGMDFVRGAEFPRWRNRLLVAALKYEEIRLLHLDEDRVIHQQIVMKNAGRVRDAACAPDGSIYAVMNGPDMVLRLTQVRDLNAPLNE